MLMMVKLIKYIKKMGLDISCYNVGFRAGSYSYFNNFRNWVAMLSGITALENMEGFGGIEKWNGKLCRHLLNHSDCDGRIPPRFAKVLLKDLLEVKNRWGIWKNLRDKGMDFSLFDNKFGKDWKYDEEGGFEDSLDEWIRVCNDSVDNDTYIEFG